MCVGGGLYLPLREHLINVYIKSLHQLTFKNFKWICPSQCIILCYTKSHGFFLSLVSCCLSEVSEKRKFPFITRQTVVGVLYQTALWREKERERERALCRHLTFLYSLTNGALKAFRLWSSCGKKKKNQGAWAHFIYWYSIFIFQLQSKLANMPSLCIFPSEPCLPTIISTDILCVNAVIDTFITSKGIQFSFQSSTGMNSATSSVANNKGPLPWAKGWRRLLYAFKRKVCQTVFQRQHLF